MSRDAVASVRFGTSPAVAALPQPATNVSADPTASALVNRKKCGTDSCIINSLIEERQMGLVEGACLSCLLI